MSRKPVGRPRPVVRVGLIPGVLALGVLALAHALVLANFIGPGLLSGTRDDPSFFLAHSAFWQHSFRQGEFPLWNPHVQYGGPEFWQFHPVAILVHLLAPTSIVAYKIYTFLPGWLVGVGAWLLLGLFVRRPVVRLLGALLVQYSGFSFSYLVNPLVLLGFAHVPFLLYAAERAVRRPQALPPLLGLAAGTALLTAAAYPQAILYGLLGVVTYTGARLRTSAWGRRPPIPRTVRFAHIALFIALGAGAGVLPLALLSVLPGQMYAGLHEHLRSPAWYLSGSLPPRNLLVFFLLNIAEAGSDPILNNFANVLPWFSLGVLLYLRYRPRRLLIPIAAAAAVAFFIALGRFNPAYVWLIARLPEPVRIDGSQRAMLITAALLPVWAALGYGAFLRRVAPGRRDWLAAGLIVGAFAATLAVTVAFGVTVLPVLMWLFAGYAIATVVFCGAALGMPRARQVAGGGLLVLVVLTPLTVRSLHPWFRDRASTIPVWWITDNPARRFIQDTPAYRFATAYGRPTDEQQSRVTRARVLPDAQLLYGWYGTGNYVTVARHRGYFLDDVASEELLEPEGALPLTRLGAVRWVISGRRLPNAGLRLLGRVEEGGQATFFYEVRDPLPRAFVPRAVRLTGEPWELLRHGERFDPDALAVVEIPGAGHAVEGPSGPGQATILASKNHRVDLEVKMDRAGWLVLSDTYYPGWQAWVDGRRVPIRRADYAFRAVPVPSGAHRITFTYRPAHLGAGLAASSLSMAALVVVAVVTGRRRRRCHRPPHPQRHRGVFAP